MPAPTSAVRAEAALRAEVGASGRTRLTRLRSAPPITLRETAPGHVHLVGTAAGPLGGDRLRLQVHVADGATLEVTSAAASLIHPGARGDPSTYDIAVEVGDHATLTWRPEPTILVRNADHHTTTRIELAPTATLRWHEILVLGRHHDETGSTTQRLRVDRAGTPILRHDLRAGPRHPASTGPATLADARVIATALDVDPDGTGASDGAEAEAAEAAAVPDATAIEADGVRAAILPLSAAGATLTIALGPRVEPVRAALAARAAPTTRAAAAQSGSEPSGPASTTV